MSHEFPNALATEAYTEEKHKVNISYVCCSYKLLKARVIIICLFTWLMGTVETEPTLDYAFSLLLLCSYFNIAVTIKVRVFRNELDFA